MAAKTKPRPVRLSPTRIAEISLYPPGPRPLAGPDAGRNAADWNLNCHGDTRCCNCVTGFGECFDARTCGKPTS